MKTIYNRDEFLSNIDEYGNLIEQAILVEGCQIWDLENVTSLKGLTLSRDCTLWHLKSVTSLDGLTLSKDCTLWDLESVTSLDGLTLAEGCRLRGLNSITSLDGVTLFEGCRLEGLNDQVILHASPSESEMKIIKQIPINDIDMGSCHCGTSHCLAGWSQILSGREINNSTCRADGMELLPSLAPYFYAPNGPVKDLIERLQKEV